MPRKAKTDSATTLATRLFAEVRSCIISGTFPPQHKLRVRQLAAQFGTGLSPVREALNRLSRDGLVSHNDQRGFVVTPVSEQELDELILARCWLNERALRESIARGGAEWEEALVVAFHRLSRTPRRVGDSDLTNPDWDQAHRLFHRRLIEACGSRWLVDFGDQLFDVADRYRNLALSHAHERVQHEHRRIMDAAVARDADEATELLNMHFRRTADLSRGALRRHTAAAEKRSPRGRASPARANSPSN
jgi:GntR family transcriptional regulator, carbon starvation induced regulator